MTTATERPQSGRITVVISIFAMAVAALVIVVGQFIVLLFGIPLFVVLTALFALLAQHLSWPLLKWGVLGEIWSLIADIAVFLR